jgi:glycerophosphoryl diester phosphodiesterase
LTLPARIVGHRGARAVAPENTLAGLRRGLADGADALEFDVRVLRDGHPVLMHDATVDRTTGGCGPVASFDLAAARSLDAGARFAPAFAGERVPSLGDVLQELLGRAILAVEMKEVLPNPALEVLADARRTRPGAPLILASFQEAALERAASRLPDVDRALVLPQGRGLPPPDVAGRLGLWGVFAPQRDADRRLADDARARGLALWVYTVNRPDRAARLVALGAGGIITDDPARIRARLAPRS